MTSNGNKRCNSYVIPEDIRVFNNTIYHYTSIETLVKYILPTNTIKFGKYEDMNDPWEYNLKLVDLGDIDNYGFDYNTYRLVESTFDNFVRKHIHIFCTTKNYIFDDIPIWGYNHPRMWAQYGRNHRGVCLAFNKEKLEKCIVNSVGDLKMVFSECINYSSAFAEVNGRNKIIIDPSRINDNAYLLNTLYEYITQNKVVFFTKREDWEDEKEFRFLVVSASNNAYYIDFKDALESIIVGDKTFESNVLSEFETFILNQYNYSLDKYSEKGNIKLLNICWNQGEAICY